MQETVRNEILSMRTLAPDLPELQAEEACSDDLPPRSIRDELHTREQGHAALSSLLDLPAGRSRDPAIVDFA